jgi:hypothetical protein
VEIEPQRRLKVTHFSPLSGDEDRPENYHTVLYELEQHNDKTRVSLTQDNNSSEEAAEHSKANWETMLAGLKQVVERSKADRFDRACAVREDDEAGLGLRDEADEAAKASGAAVVPEHVDRTFLQRQSHPAETLSSTSRSSA